MLDEWLLNRPTEKNQHGDLTVSIPTSSKWLNEIIHKPSFDRFFSDGQQH